MSAKVTDKDNGYKKMLKLLTAGKTPVVKIGVFGTKASEGHKDSEMTVGEIATIHEFGLGNCPERSFVRGYCDENTPQVTAFLKSQCEQAVANKAPNMDIVLERLGLFCVAGIQKRMSDGIPPPLKPATIDRKGSSVPLINTGQMRSCVTYQVNK